MQTFLYLLVCVFLRVVRSAPLEKDKVKISAPLEKNEAISVARNIHTDDPIAPGYALWGDQLIPKSRIPGNEPVSNTTSSTASGRNAIVHDFQRWPRGVVPYVLDQSVSHARRVIQQAFQNFQSNTCIRFVPRTSQRNYIKLFAGSGCYSYVGMINRGEQVVSLGRGCEPVGIVVHELGHAIGFDHEHSRSDRDNYLTVNWHNIKKGYESQFRKLAPSENRLFTGFDYISIMIYGNNAFSKDGRSSTIVAKNGVKLSAAFSKSGLSPDDITSIKKLYNC